MKYVVTGSLGNVSRPLTEKLIAAGHDVTVISSKEERRSSIEALGARAAIGMVEDVDFTSKTFRGADCVYTMVPPNMNASNWKQYIRSIGEKIAEAVKESGIKNVVNLSSLGAHMPEGCGPVSGLHFVEEALNKLEGVNVLHLRAGFFYTNFLNSVSMIKHQGIIGGNYGENTRMVIVHPEDIADVAAQAMLNLSFRGKTIRYVVSDEKTTQEIASIIGKAIGKEGLQWMNFKDEDTVNGLMQSGVPEEAARNYTEMGTALRSGEMISDYILHRPEAFEKSKFEAFAPIFAHAFKKD